MQYYNHMVFYEKICLKERETWRECFSNKILSHRISHNVCLPLFYPVLLRTFTIFITNTIIRDLHSHALRSIKWLLVPYKTEVLVSILY